MSKRSLSKRGFFVGSTILFCIIIVLSTFLKKSSEQQFQTITPCQPKVTTKIALTNDTQWVQNKINFSGKLVEERVCPNVPVYENDDGTIDLGFGPWITDYEKSKENLFYQTRDCYVDEVYTYDPSYKICQGKSERVVVFGPWGPCEFSKQKRTCSAKELRTPEYTERACTIKSV